MPRRGRPSPWGDGFQPENTHDDDTYFERTHGTGQIDEIASPGEIGLPEGTDDDDQTAELTGGRLRGGHERTEDVPHLAPDDDIVDARFDESHVPESLAPAASPQRSRSRSRPVAGIALALLGAVLFGLGMGVAITVCLGVL